MNTATMTELQKKIGEACKEVLEDMSLCFATFSWLFRQ
jgi:hypothetical protein